MAIIFHSYLIVFIIILWIENGQSYPQTSPSRFNDDNSMIMDFRYNNARIDGIVNLLNGSLLIISNGYYWLLDYYNPLPLPYNVIGRIEQLYDGFDTMDAIWLDPYNDISPQIYLISNSPEYGIRVVCKEFDDEPFNDVSSFCHLPVDNRWLSALKDIDPNRPIDAATWRNRTKNQDGGFWVFFQGKKMITIDPYEMKLRFTYDIQKWMSINDSLTAAFYDYHKSVYHLFLDNNRYYTWTVNVSYMNSLPMSWDRAFLHGKLSQLMMINRDFFGFSDKDIRPYSQPNFRKNSIDIHTNHLVPDDDDDDDVRHRRLSTTTTTTTENSRHLWLPRKPISKQPINNYENNNDNDNEHTNSIQSDYNNPNQRRFKNDDDDIFDDFNAIKSDHVRQTDSQSNTQMIRKSSTFDLKPSCTQMTYLIIIFIIIILFC